MTSAENWELVKLRRNDGSEIETRQFRPDPEEERLRAELAANANANLRRLHIAIESSRRFWTLRNRRPNFCRGHGMGEDAAAC